MRTFFLAGLVNVLVVAVAYGESAHKGWRAVPDKWPSPGNSKPFQEGTRGSTFKEIPIQAFGMTGPFVRVDKPDPPTKAAFNGEYWFRQRATVTVQKVYLLTPGDDGAIATREIKTNGFSVYREPVVEGYFAASFRTEEIEFKEGDTFVVVLKVDGKATPVFLRILYVPFEPS